MTARYSIIGIGEALFDMLPGGEQLGGAPINLAIHAHQLLAPLSGRGVPVSRVGQDGLGQRVAEVLAERGLTTDYLQTDPDRETGQVFVELDARGQPDYDIADQVAWDMLQFDPDLEDLARHTDAVAFGSLAQRDAQSRNTIYRFLDATKPRVIRLFDVNLRQSYYDRFVIERSLERATVLKLNQDELPVLANLFHIDGDTDEQVRSLIKKFELKSVAMTRGKDGTTLYSGGERYDGEPASYDAAENADPVGAGDACAAALLVAMITRRGPQQAVDLANRVGAYVASQPGATPVLPEDLVHSVTG